MTFSGVEVVNQWKINNSSGMFTVLKTANYIFAVSGATNYISSISLYLKKSSQSVQLVTILESTYGGKYVPRGFNRMFVKKLYSGDHIYLQVEGEHSITTSESSPFTFSCLEIV